MRAEVENKTSGALHKRKRGEREEKLTKQSALPATAGSHLHIAWVSTVCIQMLHLFLKRNRGTEPYQRRHESRMQDACHLLQQANIMLPVCLIADDILQILQHQI